MARPFLRSWSWALLALVWFGNTNASDGKIAPLYDRKLIVNGYDAARGRYPFFVTIGDWCGGALIAPDIVLTAGHCKPQNHVKKTRVRVGTFSPKGDKPNEDYQEFGIVDLMVHPGFVYVGDDEFILDFMLIKLSGFSTKPFVAINANNRVPADNQKVFALGVGSTNPEPDGQVVRPKNLQEVHLNYISNHECSGSVDPVRHLTYHGRIDPSMFCTTGGPNNTRDACYYDSGSPIIIKGDKPEQDVLVGLVSWGELCADPNFPGVNARVSNAIEWITSTVCEMSDSPPEFCFASKAVLDSWWRIAFVASILTATSAIFCRIGRKRYKRTTYVELSTA